MTLNHAISVSPKATIQEYVRPWKLITLGIGLTALIIGAFYYKQPDWDVGVSLVMGLLTYLTAPWGLRVFKLKRWGLMPVAILFYWLSVDWSYVQYNVAVGRPVSAELRQANLFASSLLYLLCGFIWSPQMTFREVASSLASIFCKRK